MYSVNLLSLAGEVLAAQDFWADDRDTAVFIYHNPSECFGKSEFVGAVFIELKNNGSGVLVDRRHLEFKGE